MGTITFNRLAPGEGMRPSVEPKRVTHAELVAIRDAGNLVPGQLYRITDYVATVNDVLIDDARSANHPFDVVVMALTEKTLSEDACAALHDGDTYFANSRLEAWQLKYRLDNVNWSARPVTVATEGMDEYDLFKSGVVVIDGENWVLWESPEVEMDYDTRWMVSENEEIGAGVFGYDPELGEIIEDGWQSTIEEIRSSTKDGFGTVTWMKDEWDNECPYDFKNIQFKRYMCYDISASRTGLDSKYMVASTSCPIGLEIEDANDYIWAYTFSSDNSGGEQEDYSVGDNGVHDNIIMPYGSDLPNNVIFGGESYGNRFGINCYNNTFGRGSIGNSLTRECSNNSLGDHALSNTLGVASEGNSFGQGCYNNSMGEYSYYNYFGDSCYDNVFLGDASNNTIGNQTSRNFFGSYFQSNTIGVECEYCHFGNYVAHNEWADRLRYSTIFNNVDYTKIVTNSVLNVQILNGVSGEYNNIRTLNFAASKSYTQVACMSSSNTLLIYIPGDSF